MIMHDEGFFVFIFLHKTLILSVLFNVSCVYPWDSCEQC